MSCAALGDATPCIEARLGKVERDLFSYLELGCSTQEIATARGASLCPFSAPEPGAWRASP